MDTSLSSLLPLILASNVMTAFITALFGRKKSHAEAMTLNVDAALKLEDRAIIRYRSAQDALDAAQRALDVARTEIRSLEDYIEILHCLLEKAGIAYPDKRAMLV